MESSEVRRRRIKQNRRKERAEKVEKERAPNDPDEDDNEGPPVKKPRKRPRKPTAEEDIVDGFAILAFKNYDDLTRAIKLAEDDSGDRQRLCYQLLKRSQEGGDNNKPSSEKEKTSPKPPKPRTSSKKKVKVTENGEAMVSKVPSNESRCSAPSGGSSGVSIALSIPNPITIPIPNFRPRPQHPKKARINGPPSAKEAIHNVICESDETGDKNSDGCSDLFAPPRKDSSPHLPDNLISSNEQKGLDAKQTYINHELPKSTSTATTGTSIVNLCRSPALEDIKPKIEHPETTGAITALHGTNGSLICNSQGVSGGDVNGVGRNPGGNTGSPISQVNEKKFVPSRPGPQTLFTPYATTAITRVSTPVERPPSTSQSTVQPESPKDQSHQPLSLPIQSEPFALSHPHRINHLHNNNHTSIATSNFTSSNSSSLISSNNITSNSNNTSNSSSVNILTIPTPNPSHNHSANEYITLSGSHIHRSSPTVDSNKVKQSGGEQQASGRGVPTPPSANQLLNRKSHTPSGKVTPTTTNKSAAFGSIARLLDSPTTSAQSRNSPTVNATVTASTNHHSPSNIVNNHPPHHHHHHHQSHPNPHPHPPHPPIHQHSHPHSQPPHTAHHHHPQSSAGAPTISSNNSNNPFGPSAPLSCSSRSHSPRGHSPSRERDSYSSNVSSLSRSSVTPVSGSQSSQLPPNLSPLQNLSYSKAASWLSVPGLSPVPRPTPPPVPPSHTQGNLVSGGGGPLSLQAGPPANPFSGYSHSQGAPHLPPPNSAAAAHAAAMFAPPILPLSTITQHPSSQPSPFGPSSDSLFHGNFNWTSSSELVRRDLESRFLASDRNAVTGAPSSFITRPGDLHPHHHPLLPPLSGVNHLQPHNPAGPNSGPPPHSALFPPPLFKDLSKLDSPFYRASLGISYPGFNGILPPHNIATPFAPPSQLAAFTPKKSGRWNAMHVRIAWEIYQHQQKGGGNHPDGGKGGNSTNSGSSSSKSSMPPSAPGQPNLGGGSGIPSSVQQASSSLAADLLRTPNHVFAGLSRPPEVGAGAPFGSPLLSPHAPPPPPSHRGTPFDPSHSIFLNATPHNLGDLLYSVTGPPLPRYPGFGGLGPTFGGLSSLGSSLLSRDLSSLAALGPSQEQWHRLHRGPPFSGPSGPLGAGWPLQRPERDVKTPTESRRHKEERGMDKRHEPSYLSESSKIGGGNVRDASPFRDRSPVRPARTPLENGDTDSRSSRSSDSHSAVHPQTSKSIARLKDEAANGERDKTCTPLMSFDRDKIPHPAILNDINKPPTHLTSSHPSRLFHPSSPLGVPITSGWDAFPGVIGAGPRMSSAESFRLSLLQLSEREREMSRVPSHQASMRPPFFANGPFGNLPLGGMGVGPPPTPGSTGSSNSSKSSPSSVPIPLLNPSPSPAHMHGHSLSHLHSSQNGPNSPIKLEDQPSSSSTSRSKEESHQSR